MLRVYVDDSADEKKEQVVVAGAYMGYYKGWNKVWKQWKQMLKKHNLAYFRSSEYYSLRGEFERFRDPVKFPRPLGSKAARSALADLEGVIEGNELAGIAVCVPMQTYCEVRSTEKRADEIFNPDAFQTALMSLFHRCAVYARDEFKPQETVNFYCDDSPQSSVYVELYRQFKQHNRTLAPFLSGLTIMDDKKCPQLQTADMMAHLARGRFIDYLNDPAKAQFTIDPEKHERFKRLKVHVIEVWTKRHMLAVLRNEMRVRGLEAQ